MNRPIIAFFLGITFLSACARPAPPQAQGQIITNSCRTRPASWPDSKYETALGARDATLYAGTGRIVVDVGVDSIPSIHGAQISLIRGPAELHAPYKDSVVTITAPAGRYVLRARRIGARTLEDSIEIRNGFVDTVKVVLGREVVCLDAQLLAK